MARFTVLAYALVAFLAYGAALSSASAQEQESRMQKRILEGGTKSASFGAQRSNFEVKSFNTRSANLKEYQGQKKFRGKDYLTSDYNAVKKSSMAQVKYAAKNADTEGRGGVKQLVKEHETAKYGVKEARDATKAHDAKNYATKEVKWRGPSQDAIDKEGPAAMGSIQSNGSFRKLETIDDIRDLLNKLD